MSTSALASQAMFLEARLQCLGHGARYLCDSQTPMYMNKHHCLPAPASFTALASKAMSLARIAITALARILITALASKAKFLDAGM